MQEWLDFIKSLVRPFLILWGAVIYGICIMKGVEVPPPVAFIFSAITIEYFGERAVMRLKGK